MSEIDKNYPYNDSLDFEDIVEKFIETKEELAPTKKELAKTKEEFVQLQAAYDRFRDGIELLIPAKRQKS